MNQPTAPCSPPSASSSTSRPPSPAGMRPRAQNQTSPPAKTSPIIRPQKRWVHSSQKIPLNPASPKPWFTSSYCGMVR